MSYEKNVGYKMDLDEFMDYDFSTYDCRIVCINM